jgi:beta-N-acetylhexosaminidase
MTSKIYLISFVFLLVACSVNKPVVNSVNKTTPSLDDMISEMVMVGFREAEIDENTPIYHILKNGYAKGIILFSKDWPSDFTMTRNIKSKAQVQKLCADLQKLGNNKLLIAIDEEGGRVSRLNAQSGYATADSAENIGAKNDLKITREWSALTANKVKESGFNVNFAPDVDLAIEKKTGGIGRLKRSFSDNPDVVIKNANVFIEEHKKVKVLTAIKHFPGHGSAKGDTHDGFVDITDVWKNEELLPFKALIEGKNLDMVMTSHLFNANFDTLPATLSYKVITGKLRNELGWKGVVISDDMHMGAMTKNFTFEKSIELAINAGVDIVIFSNNMAPIKAVFDEKTKKETNVDPYDSFVGAKVFFAIKKLVKEGKITPQRVKESYDRIMLMRSRIQ